MDWIVASHNAHKAAEISQILQPAGISLSVTQATEPKETATTFIENAMLKAHHSALQANRPVIADDSGICVAALGGLPGVRSARFAPNGITNTDYLLQQLAGEHNRAAMFVCVVVVLQHAADPCPLIAQGYWHGTIAHQPQGDNGFGYDPIFIPSELSCSAAELSATNKNAISHRGKALSTLLTLLDPHVV